MANIGAIIASIRNIMRQDRGISGDAQRLEQLGWMLFLKIIDDKDKELKIIKDNYESVIPSKFQWRNWATDTEGITGDELLDFIDRTTQNDKGLFATLSTLTNPKNPKRADIVQQVFDGTNNFMKSGYEMRKVINELNKVDFNSSKDKQVFGTIYESILVELRDAGNKGEYYTPRAVTRLMTEMTNPKLGEKVLDPASGTAGFLTEAIDFVRENYVKTVDDEHILQGSITGWEFKPVPFVLGLTNLILHEIDIPDYHYIDSLKKEYNSIGRKDQVDVILANPPFGASIANGIETNFPSKYRCKESADLFVILILKLLKNNGRCAIVLPDGSITGSGVKERIREKLLTDCNLHTIIRLPQSTFFPAAVSTNLLFFDKGSSTKDIWYYEHKLPEGQKSYSKTKQIKFEEFKPLIHWWNNREETEIAWKVNINDLKNWDLDIKNPTQDIIEYENSEIIYEDYQSLNEKIENSFNEITNEVFVNPNVTLQSILSQNISILKTVKSIKLLKTAILKEAIQGNLTIDWRKNNLETESAKHLLNKIKEERVKESKGKKIKKSELIDKNEIPFSIPKTWVWTRLNDLYFTTSGGTPSRANHNYWNGNITWYKSGELTDGVLDAESKEKITNIGLKESSANIFPKGTLLIAMYGATAGKLSILNREASTNQAVCGFYHNQNIETKYLFYYFMANRSKMVSDSWGMSQPNISQTYLRNFVFALPPLEEQKAIIDTVDILMNKCSELEKLVKKLNLRGEILMKALFNETFETQEIKKTKVIHLPSKPTNVDYYKRTLLATEIVWQLHKEPTLGHLKLQKLIYLAQESSSMQLPTNFLQQVAGPYDPKMARSLDKQMKTKKWFEYKKTELLKFKPLEKVGEHKEDFEKFFTDEKENIQYIIDTFKTAKSDSIELVGTLYACWKKLIEEKQLVTDELISKRFYEWSEQKAKFEPNRIIKALRWMETNGIMPKK